MEYLLLAIFFSSLFPISLKIAEKCHFNAKTTIIFNFFFGGLFSVILYYVSHPLTFSYDVLTAGGIGIPTGIIYFLGLVFYQKNIAQNGLSIAALFMKIAMIIPILLSILIFLERPTFFQYLGIIIALIAIITLNGGIKQLKGVTPSLLILFLLSGLGDFANKVFEYYGNMGERNVFIFMTFFTASLCGLIKDFPVFKRNLSILNIGLGAGIGIINSLSTYFIVLSLGVFSASMTYVILNISIILIVSIIGIFFFGERLKRNEFIAYLIAIAAILFIAL